MCRIPRELRHRVAALLAAMPHGKPA